jgi:hypothetical protein
MFQIFQILFKSLADFFKCFIYSLSGKNYPYRIIPKSYFKREIKFKKLSGRGFFIARRSPLSERETFTEAGTVSTKAIESREVPNMSMNLLGGYFIMEDMKYRTLGEASKPWNGSIVFLSDFINQFEIIRNYCTIIYDAWQLHDIAIPYYSDNKNKDINKRLQQAGITGLVEGQRLKTFGRMWIHHDPTNLNYWHVELKLTDPTGKEVQSGKQAWSRSAIELVLEQYLAVGISILPQDASPIGKAVFSKN